MKGSFKPLLKRIKMRDASEGMLFMHPTDGLCRVTDIVDITHLSCDNRYVLLNCETIISGRKNSYFGKYIWAAK